MHAHRTFAQLYCLAAGAALLLAGLLGFIADASFGTGDDLEGGLLVVFEVNGWHNLVHLLSGVLLLSVAGRAPAARAVALGFGLVYGLVTVVGVVSGSDVFGILPVNLADNLLHLFLSGTGVVAGLASSTHRVSALDRSNPGRGVRR